MVAAKNYTPCCDNETQAVSASLNLQQIFPGLLLLPLNGLPELRVLPDPVAVTPAIDDMAVVHQAIHNGASVGVQDSISFLEALDVRAVETSRLLDTRHGTRLTYLG